MTAPTARVAPMSDTMPTAAAMAERLTEIADRCDALGVTVMSIEVRRRYLPSALPVGIRVEVHVGSEADADILAAEYRLGEDDGGSSLYYRRSEDLVVWAGRTQKRCACGAACTHGGGAA